MSERRLRPAWRRVRFGDVVRLSRERCADPAGAGMERYVGLEHLDSGDLCVRRWGLVAEGTTFTSRFNPGQVLFGKRRAYQRKVAVANFEGVCSGDIYVLEPRDNELLPDLLPFICQTEGFFEHAVGTSAGSLSPRTNWESLSDYEFALPPLEEQQRFASVLKATEECVDRLLDIQTSARVVLSGLLGRVFEGKAKSAQRTLADACIKVTDGTHITPEFEDAGVPFFLVKTISSGTIDWSHLNYVSDATYRQLTRRHVPKRGDVLYSVVGFSYGVAVVVDFDRPFVFQRHIAHLVPDPHILDSDYLCVFLNSPYGKRLADQAAVGTQQPTITLGALSRFHLPCPSLTVQRDLVRKVKAVHSAVRACDQRSLQTRRLLRDAFSAALRLE